MVLILHLDRLREIEFQRSEWTKKLLKHRIENRGFIFFCCVDLKVIISVKLKKWQYCFNSSLLSRVQLIDGEI
jgi:hypothetical protein